MSIKLDKIDQMIISILRKEGRITNAELSERVHLSPTPCLRRVKSLEKSGIISGYRAEINNQMIGQGVAALTSVTLNKSTLHNAEVFEQQMSNLPFIETCYTVSGQHDYVIKIHAKTLQDLEQTLKRDIASISVIDKLETTIILNEI